MRLISYSAFHKPFIPSFAGKTKGEIVNHDANEALPGVTVNIPGTDTASPLLSKI
ncbi:MAG: hypothetical protein AAGI25_20300 [Bacteroidota bacterium]